MRKVFFCLILSLAVRSLTAQPLPVRPYHNIIIDTDCGIDDFRAISMILARPEVKIKAIVVSDGSLAPEAGVKKIAALLNEFGRKDIPFAAGRTVKGLNPGWRQFNMGVEWGGDSQWQVYNSDASTLLSESLISSPDKLTIVCLGPFTSLADALSRNSSLKEKIDKIIWYSPIDPPGGFNYETDRKSAEEIINSKIRIDAISNLDDPKSVFDNALFSSCMAVTTNLARLFKTVFSQPEANARLNQGHFRLFDDLVAIYLTNPELFGMNISKEKMNVRYNTVYDIDGIRAAMTDMITGNYYAEANVVFNNFPVRHDMFDYDIRPIIDSAIARYGYDEWKANVMTDEFHGHLGVFSIVGAKMGIRAREIFGVGPDLLDVVTYAGSKPPYSCLNDGIQVSTGATLGMGTIHLAADSVMRPSAIFRYKDRAIRLTLKKEYLDKVESDINEGIVKYGLMDDGYWKLIRKNALEYWLEWDRNRIFDVEILENSQK